MGVRTLALVAVATAACTDDPSGGGGPGGTIHVEAIDIPGMYPRQLDVLFVVDDTAAMAPHTAALSGLGTSLQTALEAQTGTLPDTRIAATTTDATSGALRAPSGVTDPFLATALAPDFTRTTNFTGALATAVDGLLAVGASRSSANEPLAATQTALDGNASFLRDGYLAVIAVTATDDASSATAASYASALKARKADPADVVVIGIYDTPATRLDEFHQLFPNRNTVSAIDGSLTDVFALLAQLQKTTLGIPCTREPADLDPDLAGPQYDCALAMYFTDTDTAPLPQCTAGGPERCFEVVDDPACVEPGSGVFTIHGFPGPYHPRVRGECVMPGES